MEAPNEVARELVRALGKKEAPTNYDDFVTAVAGYSSSSPAVIREGSSRQDISAIREALENWTYAWSTVLQREPAHARLRERFTYLADVWRRETAFEASVTRRAIHWSYQQIIGMGPAALPMIFEELASYEDDWFWALTAIAGEDVARGADTLPDARQRWLEWAGRHQLASGTIG